MEIDKDYVKQEILTIPGMREAIRNQNFDEAFRLCRSTKKRQQLAMSLYLARVDFLKSLSEIPESLFRGFDSLTEIEIPGNIKSIGDLAFFGTNLEKVTFAEGLEKIGDGAFAQTKIKEVHLPKSIKELGSSSLGKAVVYCFLNTKAFNNCTVNEIINEETGELLKDKLER